MYMRQTFLILLTLLLSLTVFTSCSCFDNPANAKRLGSGYVQQENNALFVEVDGVKYSPLYVYTNGPSKKETTPPTEGMIVTLFTTHDTQTVMFIAGDLSEEYLEEYFTTNSTFAWLMLITYFACIAVLIFLPENKAKTVRAD